MDEIDLEKDKSSSLKNIYNTDNNTSEKDEFFGKLKEIFLKFWQSEQGLPYLVVFLGMVAVIFGFWNFKANVRGNFNPQTGNNTLSLNEGLSQTQISELSNKDTDSDGLSDYDELYTFYTSPYLEDTDSDGVKDKDEIAAGTDPNCPGKKTCTETERPYQPPISQPSSTQTGSEFTTIDQLLNQLGEQNLAGQEAPTSTNSQADTLQALSNLSAADLRQLLIQAGAPESLLKNVTDEQLLQMAQEALKKQAAGTP